jgi:hypothetical protein
VVVAFLALGAAVFFSTLGSAFFAAAGLASFASFFASFMLPDFWPEEDVSEPDR